jgi:hypothetical protein
MTHAHNFVVREVTSSRPSNHLEFGVNHHGPVSTVRLVHGATSFHQTNDVVPLDVVINWMAKYFLNSEPVVVIEFY